MPGITTSVSNRSIRRSFSSGEGDRLHAVCARENGVALALEHPARQIPDDVLVLDEEDRLRAGCRGGSGALAAGS